MHDREMENKICCRKYYEIALPRYVKTYIVCDRVYENLINKYHALAKPTRKSTRDGIWSF